VASARPTIRCLTDELCDGVEDPGQRSALVSGLIGLARTPLDEIDHPLLKKAFELSQLSHVDLHEHQISSVADRVWYRVKVGRHRGAVWIDGDGTAWLCAAGYRRDGDPDDFYAQFERQCIAGSEIFLPDDRDEKRRRLELADSSDRERRRLLTERVVSGIADAARTGREVRVDLPTMVDPESFLPRSTAGLSVEITSNGPDYPNELTLYVEITDYAGARYNDILIEVQSSVPGVPVGDWEPEPGVGSRRDPRWTVIVDPGWIETLLACVDELGARAISEAPPDFEIDDEYAHVVKKEYLTEAIVLGHVVRGACGKVFHPTRDPDSREICPKCARAEERLERVSVGEM
jgi:hypothetical protein